MDCGCFARGEGKAVSFTLFFHLYHQQQPLKVPGANNSKTSEAVESKVDKIESIVSLPGAENTAKTY